MRIVKTNKAFIVWTMQRKRIIQTVGLRGSHRDATDFKFHPVLPIRRNYHYLTIEAE